MITLRDFLPRPWRALQRALSDVAECRMVLGTVLHRTAEIKELIVATAAEYAARVDVATSDVATLLTDLRDQLSAALEDDQVEVDTAVREALAQFDEPIARLEKLGKPGGEVPAPESTPDVEPVGGETTGDAA